MSRIAEVVPIAPSGCVAAPVENPCQVTHGTHPAPCTGAMSAGVTNSSCSEHPLSDSGAAAPVQPQISGSVADFELFLSDPCNWEWVVSAFAVEHGHSDRNIFVSKLPATFKDADLLAMFQSFGQVVSAKVMLNVKTGVSKETGFVQFATFHDAVKARAFLRLRPTGVISTPPMPDVLTQWAQNKHDGGLYGERCQQVRKLFIRNVPVSVSQAEMRAFVSRFGEVTDVSVHSDTYEPSPNQSANRARRTQPASSSEGAESVEAETGEASSVEAGEHETIICFVTFVDAAAAMRACREIHNTTPFAACNGVPLMAKLAEDNGTRHARRQHGSMVAATASAPICGPWNGFAPPYDGQSGFSSEAATPLANAGGSGYRRGSLYAPVMAVPTYTNGGMGNGNASLSSYAMPQPPPMLSAHYLSHDSASAYSSQASTPQYTPHSNRRGSVSASLHSPGIPAPRRASQAYAPAQSAHSPMASGPTAQSTPSILSLTMQPYAGACGEQPAQQQASPARGRRAPPPPTLSLGVVQGAPGSDYSAAETLPTAAAVSLARAVIPTTTTSAPTSPKHPNATRAPRHSFADLNTSAAAPRSQAPTQPGSGAQATPHAPLSPMLVRPGTSPARSPVHMGSGGHYQQHQQQQQCPPPMNGYGAAAGYNASSSFSPEAVHEYGGPEYVHQSYDAATPLWQRRMERPAMHGYAAAAAVPIEMPQLSSCAAYGTPHSHTPMPGWKDVSPMRAKSAATSPHSAYAHTMQQHSGSQVTTPSAGSTRYRNNPYGMCLVHPAPQDPSDDIRS